MALLDEANKAEARRRFTQEVMQELETIGITKADLIAALEALDQFMDDNAATINSAIPQPARGALTNKQKARLLSWVIRQRYLVA